MGLSRQWCVNVPFMSSTEQFVYSTDTILTVIKQGRIKQLIEVGHDNQP